MRNAWSVVTLVIALALTAGLLALLVGPRGVPPRVGQGARGPEADGPTLPTDGDCWDGPGHEHAASSGSAPQPFAFDFWIEGEVGSWVRVRIEPQGGVKVSLSPRDRPDVDVMARVGSVDAGSLQSAFEIGGRRYAGGVAWDAAMRLVSLHLKSGEAAGGYRVTEHHDVDGRTYVLERRRTQRAGLIVDAEVVLRQEAH